MFDPFLRSLKKIPHTDHCENIYRGNSKLARLRRDNLQIYLGRMLDLQPDMMLVGEAPGYKGCKLTGVPFSCEALLMAEQEHAVMGMRYGYRCLSLEGEGEKERSAYMVWEELNKYPNLPLIWNIFPFHPHLPNQFYTNRSPRISELRIGQPFIQKLLTLFPIKRIAAVGKKAYQGLAEMELGKIELRCIRHPSYGGKKDFVRGLEEFMEVKPNRQILP